MGHIYTAMDRRTGPRDRRLTQVETPVTPILLFWVSGWITGLLTWQVVTWMIGA